MPIFGNKTITNNISRELKEYVINELYKRLTLSNYKYRKCETFEHLNILKHDRYHVCLNNFGMKYFVMFTKYRNKKYCFYIDTKTLKYNIFDTHIDNVNIYSVKHFIPDEFYKFTLFIGDLLTTMNNNYILLIWDLYYLNGIDYIEKAVEKKLDILEDILETSYKINNVIECCTFRVNKLYNYCDITKIIKIIIPSLDYLCSGLVFYPIFSGDRFIYKFKKDEMPPHLVYNSNKLNNKEHHLKNKNISSCNSVNKSELNENNDIIINDNINSNSNTNNIYNYNNNYSKQLQNLRNIKTHPNTLNFIISKTDTPDVYQLYLYSSETNSNKFIGIANIPTISHSQYILSLFENLLDSDIIKVTCKYAIQFKKWIPIYSDKNIIVNDYLDLNNFV